jgi:O-antigen/teichoic acid export membrane protein
MLSRKIVKTFFSLTFAETFLRFSKFLFFLLLANSVDVESFAQYNYLVSIFAIIFVISDLGIGRIVTKNLSKDPNFYYSSLLWFRISFFLILDFFAFLLLGSEIYLFFALSSIFFLDAVSDMFYSIYRAKGIFFKESRIKFYLALSYTFTSILFVFINVLSLSQALSIVFLCYLLILFNISDDLDINFSFQKKNIFGGFSKEGFILLASSIFTIAYLRIDIIMIEYFLHVENISIYAIGAKVIELAMILPMVISTILLPKMSKTKSFNKNKLIYQIFLGIVLTSVFYILSPLIITIFFSSYQKAISLIQILSFGLVFIMINNYIFTAFIANTTSKYYLYTTAFMLISNLLLNSIFIPIYGINAAAYTTIFTEFLGSVMAIYIFKRLTAKK